ncbi:hypothetical protein DNTS_007138 [Danionella cerebrum]|uniref:Apoptosis regulator Bcl-2 family BH4 domain-containing protein n=1 Tax=Danionella cerebrum TaxID=2873325 RepID=A0A553NAN3_9TELE|nr:hypothetical protein DNTS_007138 [Danionella translucida]
MANEIHYDNRNIVEKYLNHKLSKRGYVWKFQSPVEEEETFNKIAEETSPNSDRRLRAASTGVGNDSECLRALRVTRSDPHVRLYRALREAGDEIERMYQSEFEEMSNQMIFSPSSAQHSFMSVAEELFRDGVDCIAHWMTDYLNGPLENWIVENGGWTKFKPSAVSLLSGTAMQVAQKSHYFCLDDVCWD